MLELGGVDGECVPVRAVFARIVAGQDSAFEWDAIVDAFGRESYVAAHSARCAVFGVIWDAIVDAFGPVMTTVPSFVGYAGLLAVVA